MIALPVRQDPASIETFMVYLTEECNLLCGYCFVKKQPRRMSAETAKKVARFLFREDLPVASTVQLNWFGGEPFLEIGRMEEIVDEVERQQADGPLTVEFSATTNGTLFSPRIRRLIERARVALLVSLDGGREVTAQDRPFVSGRSSYAAVARNLPRFLECSPDVTVRTTFHPGALDLVERVEHLVALGASRVVLAPVLELPWEGHERALDEAYDRLADWYLAELAARRVPPLEVTNELLFAWREALRGAPRPHRSCAVGTGLIGIDPDGNLMPCHRFLYRPGDRLGTLDQPDLGSERRRPYLRLDMRNHPECEVCPAHPICGGGCRLVPLQKGRGLRGLDPSHCITMRAHHRAVRRIHDALAAGAVQGVSNG